MNITKILTYMTKTRNKNDGLQKCTCIMLGTLDFTGSEHWAPFSFFELSLVNFGCNI